MLQPPSGLELCGVESQEGLGLLLHGLTFTHILWHVRAEKEVSAARLLDHLIKAWLINGQLVAVPSSNAICSRIRIVSTQARCQAGCSDFARTCLVARAFSNAKQYDLLVCTHLR